MIHDLKCWPEYFEAVLDGRKQFEIRECRDRCFTLGDTLLLREWNPDTERYTGRRCERQVAYMTDFGQKPDHIVMGFAFSETQSSAKDDFLQRQSLVETLNEVIHDHVVTMQAAVIEWQHGKGAEEAMAWIANTLEGPGHLPDPDAPWGKDAQRYFDANKANPFPACAVCGIPSHQLWMGHGFCSTEHHDQFKAEHPDGKVKP